MPHILNSCAQHETEHQDIEKRWLYATKLFTSWLFNLQV